MTGSNEQPEVVDQPDQIVLGIVIGVAIVLVVIGLLIGGFICWIRSRNSHFKHHSSSEPDQIMESEQFVDPEISVLTSVPGTSGTQSPKTKVYFEKCKNSTSSQTKQQINALESLETEPPSYEEVLIDRKKDSRDDSQIIARL